MSGKASVRLRLRRSDSLALRQMPPLPLPVLPQLPLESSSAVAADAETHGNVGDGRSPAGRRPPAGDIEEEVGACSSLEDFSIFFFFYATHVGAGRRFCSDTPPPVRARYHAFHSAIISVFHDRRTKRSSTRKASFKLLHDAQSCSLGSGNLAAVSYGGREKNLRRDFGLQEARFCYVRRSLSVHESSIRRDFKRSHKTGKRSLRGKSM